MADLAVHPPRLMAAAPIAGLARALGATWRWRWEGRAAERAALADGPVVYAFWHGEQLPLAVAHAGRGIAGLASRSRDGALLAGVISRLGFGLVRGSTSRGGPMALRGCLRALRAGVSVALAVDGPRGPRHHAAPGAAALARLSGRPVVCATTTVRGAVRLGSWDRFVVPAPGALVTVRYGVVPARGPSTDPSEALGVEQLTAQVQQRLLDLTGPSAPAPGTGPGLASSPPTPSRSSRSSG